jgi:MFS transporter, YNFM family, putative membrane transport protein
MGDMIEPTKQVLAAATLSIATVSGNAGRSLTIGVTAFLTVVDLFAAQALLPSLVKHYQVSPAMMGLAVNACTFGMAAAGLLVAVLGSKIDKRRGILVSLVLLAIPTAALAYAPNLSVFAALRIVQGLFMATAFSLTLAHLGDRFSAEESASAFAAYITGNVASNLVGRMIAATVVGNSGLGATFFVFAGLNLLGGLLVYWTVPNTPSRESGLGMTPMMASWLSHLSNRKLRAAFAIGFCILFAFIGTFTFINFVLAAPPLGLNMMQLGIVYLVFLPSIVTTPLVGNLTSKVGTTRALRGGLGAAAAGLPLLLLPWLPAVLAGMVLVATGTFFAQAVATGFIGRTAASDRNAASGLYLACYFLGGLAGTAMLGQLFDILGWPAVIAGVGAILAIAAMLAGTLSQET